MSGGTAARLAFFYAAYFAVVGVHLPFWPAWLSSRGLSAGEIGVVLGAGVAVRIVVAPLLAQLADRRGERRRIMIGAAWAALFAFALYAFSRSFFAILAVTLAFSALWTTIMPLGESLTLQAARQIGVDYGRIRLWGSVSFIVVAVAAGRTLVGRSDEVIYWLVLGAVLGSVLGCAVLPAVRFPPASGPRAPIREVLGRPAFLRLIAASALIQSSHSIYYAFATLHWRDVGYGDDVIGWLWAEGVIAEILLFAAGRGLMRRFGPTALLAIAGVAAVARWTATGMSAALPLLVAAQSLHALTFGAAHLAAIHYIAGAVPSHLSATAQSLHASAVGGIGMGLALIAAGPLYGALGGRAYLTMAALAAAGVLMLVRLARDPT